MHARFVSGADSAYVNYADYDNDGGLDGNAEAEGDAADAYFLSAGE